MSRRMPVILVIGVGILTLSILAYEPGFVSLFDGKSLDGWTLLSKTGDGYVVKDGKIILPRGGSGNLFTKKEFSDFILRFLDNNSERYKDIR